MSKPSAPPPPLQDFDLAGNDWTRAYRLRPGLFWPVLEQLVESRDGSKSWKRARYPVAVSIIEDAEGWVDCPSCGVAFNADRSAAEVRANV